MTPVAHPMLASPSRAGRRFEPTEERQLDEALRSLAARLPGAADGLILLPEFPGPRGIPDLVAVTKTSPALEARLTMGEPFAVSVAECAVLAATSPNQTRTVVSIAQRLGARIPQIDRRLRELRSKGLVVLAGSGYRRAGPVAPIGRAYAFEAKVSDWRQGLKQAVRYASWCDAAAVVLLNTPRNIAEAKLRCQSMNIGLAIQDRWIIRPRISTPLPSHRLAVSEQIASVVYCQSPSFKA